MKFTDTVHHGHLIKRYKRFFMDVTLPSGQVVTAHLPNTGSMMGLLTPKNPVILTENHDPKRKTRFTAQAICSDGTWVGVNTHMPNGLVKQAILDKRLPLFASYQTIASEVPYGMDCRSRIDLKLSNCRQGQPDFYLEIKNVTLKMHGAAMFPDAVSLRARKHIEDLLYIKNQGFLSGIIFVVQRLDCTHFTPAKSVDEQYARLLQYAQDQGVIITAVTAQANEQGIEIIGDIPVLL